MDENENIKNESKSAELVELVRKGAYTVEDLEEALEALKTADSEAEPTKEDAEALYGIKFADKQGE